MTKKIEMTKEMAESVITAVVVYDNCEKCPLFGTKNCASVGHDECLECVHAAARVLYGTPQKLDRVEIAKGFMGVLLSNAAIYPENEYSAFPQISFDAADAFIAFAEEGGEG